MPRTVRRLAFWRNPLPKYLLEPEVFPLSLGHFLEKPNTVRSLSGEFRLRIGFPALFGGIQEASITQLK
jgi:hypothetical protein